MGNVPSHKSKLKRSGTGQSWFPESWSEDDIKNAGEYVANLPGNTNVADGMTVFGVYKGVRVGVIRTNGKIGTIFPDAGQQP
ncbi:EndoU domain-containing protein [Laceyella tengchongensis]